MRPREYAFEMLLIPTVEARREYLAREVPAAYRDLVMSHVRGWWPKRQLILADTDVAKLKRERERIRRYWTGIA